uniref:Uncharacterized protein n=1 Tax=Romanomermis culicivorax TaxID=13658 RepID=A0A915K8L2_ROMCU
MIIPSFSPSAEVQVCRTEKACEPTRQQNNGSDSDVLKTDSEENMKYYAVQLFVQYASFDEYTEAKRLIVKRRSHFTEMVAYILEYIVEKEDEERLKFANLLSKLYNDSIVDKEMLTDGFAKFVELCMDCDLVGDLRLIWDLLAVIISNIAKFSSSQGLSLSDFYSSFKAADHYKYVLFTKCLQKLVHLPVDEQKSAHGDFFTSGANYWSIFDFVDRSALIDDLKDKGISLPEFSPFAPLNNPNDNTTNSDGESREIEELFGPCLPVFRRFFTGNKPLEKILLNTLCEVYYENQCPKDSLTSIFELLIMENVLPRDAFLDWWSLKQQCRAYDVVLRDLKLKTFVEELQHSI